MRGLIPFGGLEIAGGSQTLGLTTNPTALSKFSAAAGGQSSDSTVGDPAVRPDVANNRLLLNAPGTYLIQLGVSGTTDTAADITFQIRKNGNAVPNAVVKDRWTNAVKNGTHLTAVVVVTAADIPSGGQPTFADPAVGGLAKFAGSGGAPLTECPVDVAVTAGAGTPNLTLENVRFLALRIG